MKRVRLHNPFESESYECSVEYFVDVDKPVVFFANHKGMRLLTKILMACDEFEVELEPFNDDKYMCSLITYKGKLINLKGVD